MWSALMGMLISTSMAPTSSSLPDHQLLPELTYLSKEMPVEAVGDETMIEDTIVGAAEGMELCTSTPKTKVHLVERMTSRICRVIVVVLILTVRIVNVWYPYTRPPLSSQR